MPLFDVTQPNATMIFSTLAGHTLAALLPHFGFFLNWPQHFAARLGPPPDAARIYVGHECG